MRSPVQCCLAVLCQHDSSSPLSLSLCPSLLLSSPPSLSLCPSLLLSSPPSSPPPLHRSAPPPPPLPLHSLQSPPLLATPGKHTPEYTPLTHTHKHHHWLHIINMQ